VFHVALPVNMQNDQLDCTSVRPLCAKWPLSVKTVSVRIRVRNRIRVRVRVRVRVKITVFVSSLYR